MSAPAILRLAQSALADLASPQRRLFESYYVQLQPKEVAARDVGVSPAQFDELHQDMLKGLRYG